MSAYERYCEVRDKLGVKNAQVASACGIGQSTFSDWKNGRSTPKPEKMRKIADYLGTTVDYILTGEKSDGYYVNPKTADIAQQIFENKELSLLFDVQKDMSPEDLQAIYQMALALKRKESN